MDKREMLDLLALEYWRHVKEFAKRKIEGEMLAGIPPYSAMLNDTYKFIYEEKNKRRRLRARDLIVELEEYKAVCLIEFPVFIEKGIWTKEQANDRFNSVLSSQRWLCHIYNISPPSVTTPEVAKTPEISET